MSGTRKVMRMPTYFVRSSRYGAARSCVQLHMRIAFQRREQRGTGSYLGVLACRTIQSRWSKPKIGLEDRLGGDRSRELKQQMLGLIPTQTSIGN